MTAQEQPGAEGVVGWCNLSMLHPFLLIAAHVLSHLTCSGGEMRRGLLTKIKVSEISFAAKKKKKPQLVSVDGCSAAESN